MDRKHRASNRRGAGLVEYALAAGLIAMIATLAVQSSGARIGALLASITTELAWADHALDAGDPAPKNQRTKLLADDGAAGDQFGSSVAIAGKTAFVGAPNDGGGSVYLFDTDSHDQIAKLTVAASGSNDFFGISVDVSADTAIVGASGYSAEGYFNSGQVYFFDTRDYTLTQPLRDAGSASFHGFGTDVALSGDRAIIGAPGYYPPDGGPGDKQTGAFYGYDTTSGDLSIYTVPAHTSDEELGHSVALDGQYALIGAPGRYKSNWPGAAYILKPDDSLTRIRPDDSETGDQFGLSVEVSGAYAIVGAPGKGETGSAYLFDVRTGDQLFKLTPNDGAAGDRFGARVAISGTTAIVGADQHDNNGAESGAAYLFDAASGKQIAKVIPDDGAAGDLFGASVAISGGTAIVGARKDGDNGSESGSGYLFD